MISQAHDWELKISRGLPCSQRYSLFNPRLTLFFDAHTQLNVQYSIARRAADTAGFGHTFAAQFTIRF